MDTPKPVIRVEPGTRLTIPEGAFAGIVAEVTEVWSGEEVVKVTAIIFGRPVHLDLDPWTFRPPLLPREDSWPESMSLSRMLASVQGYATDRQLRLFAVACFRRICHLLTEQRCAKLIERRDFAMPPEEWGSRSPDFLLRAVELLERLAEGEVHPEKQEKAFGETTLLACVRSNYFGSRDSFDDPIDHELLATCEAALAVCAAAKGVDAFAVANRAACASYLDKGGSEDGAENVDPAETAAQRELVRDVFGRPLCLATSDPTWLTPTVTRLAQSIYDSRAFDEMPILGDALEDAGCADEAVLSHLRGSGPHVRGCWVLDLLLGRS